MSRKQDKELMLNHPLMQQSQIQSPLLCKARSSLCRACFSQRLRRLGKSLPWDWWSKPPWGLLYLRSCDQPPISETSQTNKTSLPSTWRYKRAKQPMNPKDQATDQVVDLLMRLQLNKMDFKRIDMDRVRASWIYSLMWQKRHLKHQLRLQM